MQTQSVQAGAALSALAQLLGISSEDGTTSLDSEGGVAFLATLRDQLREKLLASGLDADALDGQDASALLVQFLALQHRPADTPVPAGTDVSVLPADAVQAGVSGVLVDQLQAFIDASLEQRMGLADQAMPDRSELDGALLLQQSLSEMLSQSAADAASDQPAVESAPLLRQLLSTALAAPQLRSAFEQHFGTADPFDVSPQDLLAWLDSFAGAAGAGRLPGSGSETGQAVAELSLALNALLTGHSRDDIASARQVLRSPEGTVEPTGQAGRDTLFRAIAEAVAQKPHSDAGTRDANDSLLTSSLENPRTVGQIAFARTLDGAQSDHFAGARKNPLTLDLSRLLQPGGEARLAEQLRRVAGAGLNAAEIKLHPPSLGALEVRVAMQAERAHVQFISPHPVVREVLEAAMPRLREALAQGGLGLGDMSVSDQAADQGGTMQRQSQGDPGNRRPDWSGDATSEAGLDLSDAATAEVAGASTLSALSRRLDYFI